MPVEDTALLKILIVDDEQIVLEALSRTIDWPHFGFRIIGSTANGQAALAICETTVPDIVVTDVRMPVMDGLELTKLLKERYPTVRILIFSAYADFRYAQKALTYGANDYLLKGELGCEDILGSVLRLGRAIISERARDCDQSRSLAVIRRHLDDLKKNALESLVNGMYSPAEVEQKLLDLQIELSFNNLLILMIDFEISPQSSLIQLELESVFEHAFVLPVSKRLFRVVANLASPPVAGKQMTAFLKRLHQKLRRKTTGWVNLGCSTSGDGWLNLPQKLAEAEVALEFRFYAGADSVTVFDEPLMQNPFPISTLLQFLKEVNDALTIGRISAIPERIDYFFVKLKSFKFFPVEDVYHGCWLMGQLILEKLLSINRPMIIKGFENLLGNGLKTKLHQYAYIDALHSYFGGLVREMLQVLFREVHPYSETIQKTIEYITDHLDQEITLSVLAGKVYCNPVYLSQLFKKETGENFSDYLIRFRIQYAEFLLKNTNLSVTAIAAQVGYPNSSYFSQVFFKVTQTHPSKYRV
jgi:two-component system response regulator YesN